MRFRLGAFFPGFLRSRRCDEADMSKGPQLVVGDAAVIVIAIKLRKRERERIARPRVMAGDALRPARIVPALFAAAAWGMAVRNRKKAFLAGGRDKRSVGLLVVPFVAVTVPDGAVEVQNLRFQPPPAL